MAQAHVKLRIRETSTWCMVNTWLLIWSFLHTMPHHNPNSIRFIRLAFLIAFA
jgi:hypothetical protein